MSRTSLGVACLVGMLLASGVFQIHADDNEPFIVDAPQVTPVTRPAAGVAWVPDNLEQRRKVVKARHEADVAEFRKVLLDAYQASGDTSPKWDENARMAISSYALMKVPELSDGFDGFATLHYSYSADQQGCPDALVQYALARTERFYTSPLPADGHRQIEAGRHLQESEYPDACKLIGRLRTIQFVIIEAGISAEDRKKEVDDGHREVITLADRIANAPLMQRDDLISLMEVAGEASFDIYHDRMKLPSELLALFKAYPDRSSVFTAEGSLWIQYAWDARGGGWGNTVTDDSWRLFAERLARAEALLTKAWELDHDNALAAQCMLTVCKGRGHPRDVMERWFKAAVAADPDAVSAYGEKLEYLEPKWGGSAQAMISFGRECTAVLPADSPGRLTIANVYCRLSQYDTPDYSFRPQRSYFAKSPKSIWTDMEAAYEPYIKACGLNDYHRLRYARFALWCGQPDKARELLRPFGEYRGHLELSQEDINSMRKELGLPQTYEGFLK